MSNSEDVVRNQLQSMGYRVSGPPYRVSTGERFIIGFKENHHRDGFSATFVAQSLSSESRHPMEFTISGTQVKMQNLDTDSCLSKGLTKFKEYLDELVV
jgi:hypothetical protein